MKRLLPASQLLPYTTLFRSLDGIDVLLDGEPRREAQLVRIALADGIAAALDEGRVLVGLVPRGDGELACGGGLEGGDRIDRKSTRLNSSHVEISYAVFCLKK